MAVYTHLTDRALRQLLRPFKLGDLIDARGISAGTRNTIYDIRAERGHFILRILENRSQLDARFEEVLLQRLGERGLPVPRMMGAGRRGFIVSIAPRQQLSIFQFLPGREVGVFEVTVDHASQVGMFLANMHQAARGLGRQRRNRFDVPHIERTLKLCQQASLPEAARQDVELLVNEVSRHQTPRDLPRGVLHSDLFIDNARFQNGVLCGVIDFEMACTGPLMYDLAVAITDWAFLHDQFLPERAAALLRGYETVRPLKQQERHALYDLCRFAAARFATTRLYDFEVRRRPQAQRLYKDYRHFLQRLISLQNLRDGGAFARSLGVPAQAEM